MVNEEGREVASHQVNIQDKPESFEREVQAHYAFLASGLDSRGQLCPGVPLTMTSDADNTTEEARGLKALLEVSAYALAEHVHVLRRRNRRENGA